jgi:hypothetical protein
LFICRRVVPYLRFLAPLVIIISFWEICSGHFARLLLSHADLSLGLAGACGAILAENLCELAEKKAGISKIRFVTLQPAEQLAMIAWILGLVLSMGTILQLGSRCSNDLDCAATYWRAVFYIVSTGTAVVYLVTAAICARQDRFRKSP